MHFHIGEPLYGWWSLLGPLMYMAKKNEMHFSRSIVLWVPFFIFFYRELRYYRLPGGLASDLSSAIGRLMVIYLPRVYIRTHVNQTWIGQTTPRRRCYPRVLQTYRHMGCNSLLKSGLLTDDSMWEASAIPVKGNHSLELLRRVRLTVLQEREELGSPRSKHPWCTGSPGAVDRP